MAKDIPLKTFTDRERGILVEAIPHVRRSDSRWFEDEGFQAVYDKWMTETKGFYHNEEPFEQFRMLVSKMRKIKAIEWEKVNNTKDGWMDDGIIRKVITNTPVTK